ncbi:MAG: hypothetical protein EZS28_012142 [Streblomastix strix]|uniref:TmcB/TmcC TPR repeats domain-containing protein n=1 Tax=Streblomastix strix TaxID=222440 RepID=A0A5J4WDB0_9EUKA|nr:MAG: hypothetical protein EZS28_012142 [Streblomastix strix]
MVVYSVSPMDQRLLYDWQFWRGVVGVLVPGVLVPMLTIQNPYYSFWSNYLQTIPWTIFGVMRLFLEIGYAIEKASNMIAPQIIFLIFGIISSVILIIVIYNVMRILEGGNWLVTSQGLPLVDISEIEQLNLQQSYNYQQQTEQNEQKSSILNKATKSKLPGLPKLKDATDIEPRLRFLQDKDIRSNEYIKYADYVYTYGFKRHKKNSLLQFQYGIFLQYYRKNWIKAQSVFKLARSSNPSIPLRFILYCKTKEGGGQGGQGGSELSSITFLSKMAQAEEFYQAAKQGLLEFFENLANIKTNFNLIYPHLKTITESEAKSRKCFEELMIMQPHNTAVLRNYARLQLDIYNDEDTAEIILQRAEMIEDDQSGSEQPGDQSSQVPRQVSQFSIRSLIQKQDGKVNTITNKKKKKKKKKKGGSGDNVITDIQGGQGQGNDNTTMKKVIIVLIVLSHLIAVISQVVGTVMYIVDSSNSSQQFLNLLQICELAGYSGRLPTFAIETFFLDIENNFRYSGINDGKAESVPKWDSIKQSFTDHGKLITDIISVIYDVTSNTQPWEVADINTYLFEVIRVGPIGTGSQRGQPTMISQEWQPSSLIRSMTNLAQMSGQLGRLNSSSPNLELQSFYSYLQYIIFNSPVAILASCKRAITGYWEQTNTIIQETILVEVLIVVLLLALNITVMIAVFVFFTIKVHKERKQMMIKLLDIPKQKMQGIIRRLLQQDNEDSEDDSDINMTGFSLELDVIDENAGQSPFISAQNSMKMKNKGQKTRRKSKNQNSSPKPPSFSNLDIRTSYIRGWK